MRRRRRTRRGEKKRVRDERKDRVRDRMGADKR